MLFGAAVLLSPLTHFFQIFGGRFGPSDALLALLVLLFAVRRPDLFLREIATVYGAASTVLVFWVVLAWVAGTSQDVTELLSPSLSLILYLLLVPAVLRGSSVGASAGAAIAILIAVDCVLVLSGQITGFGSYSTGIGRIHTILTPVGTIATNGAVGIMLAIGYLVAGVRPQIWWLPGVCGVVLVLADGSRSAALGALLGSAGLVLLCLAYRRHLHVSGRAKFASVCAASVGVLMLAVPSVFGERTTRQSFSVFDELHQTEGARLGGYAEATAAIMTHPVLGPGFHSTHDAASGQVVHNAWLQLAADVGLPAALCLGILCLLPIAAGARKCRAALRQRESLSAAASMAGVGVLLCVVVKLMTHPLGLVLSDWIPYLVGVALVQSPRRPMGRVPYRIS